MAFALGVMALWQFWLVGKGETTVEAHDNGTLGGFASFIWPDLLVEYYRKLAKRKKRVSVHLPRIGIC
jgi:hypothetical protein